ncbi:hypothetical protein DFP73DRAFT_570548 [Morchella snyderi]|nr:hypothetical protein DFP73DRAFT_570548 [Morchella snyderi]
MDSSSLTDEETHILFFTSILASFISITTPICVFGWLVNLLFDYNLFSLWWSNPLPLTAIVLLLSLWLGCSMYLDLKVQHMNRQGARSRVIARPQHARQAHNCSTLGIHQLPRVPRLSILTTAPAGRIVDEELGLPPVAPPNIPRTTPSSTRGRAVFQNGTEATALLLGSHSCEIRWYGTGVIRCPGCQDGVRVFLTQP